MATELFKPEQTLDEIHTELMEHLLEYSYIIIKGDGKISFSIPENGACSRWFDDLVEIIATKIANTDKEMMKFCIDKGVDLFDVKIKK